MIKLRKKSRKKVQWFLMLQEKKGEKLAIKRQVLPFWIIFPQKLFFFPSWKQRILSIKYIVLTNINYVESKQYSNENIGKWKRYQVFYTNSDFLIPITLQPNCIDLRYFQLSIRFNETIKVRNVKGFHHQVAKIVIR